MSVTVSAPETVEMSGSDFAAAVRFSLADHFAVMAWPAVEMIDDEKIESALAKGIGEMVNLAVNTVMNAIQYVTINEEDK